MQGNGKIPCVCIVLREQCFDEYTTALWLVYSKHFGKETADTRFVWCVVYFWVSCVLVTQSPGNRANFDNTKCRIFFFWKGIMPAMYFRLNVNVPPMINLFNIALYMTKIRRKWRCLKGLSYLSLAPLAGRQVLVAFGDLRVPSLGSRRRSAPARVIPSTCTSFGATLVTSSRQYKKLKHGGSDNNSLAYRLCFDRHVFYLKKDTAFDVAFVLFCAL